MQVAPGGQENDRDLPGLQFREKFKTVLSGEHHVQERQSVGAGRDIRKVSAECGAVEKGDRLVACGFQIEADEFVDVLFIFDHKYFTGHRVGFLFSQCIFKIIL